MTDITTDSKKVSLRLPLAIIVGLGLAVAAGLVGTKSMMTAQANAADIQSAPTGTAVEVAVQVTALPSAGFFDGQLLEKQGFGYKHTDQTLHFRFADDATVAMGQRSDVNVGAILSVNAMTVSPDERQLEAKRVVILTGYVSVD
jgi:hypothetical protein